MTIFVSIAAYRDPDLAATIEDCLAKARHPEELCFGICWQRGPNEPELPFFDDHRFRIREVSWRNSAGACWARAEIMKLWQGEEFFLQLDSHHRFSQDWDVKLLHHVQRTGSDKPVIGTYAPPFAPWETAPAAEPMQMNFDRFTEDGIPLFQGGVIPDWHDLSAPIPARFISAHFLFTIGRFVGDVPYDPDLYFLGEEITLAIRAFTNGYDLFHPPEHILWHEYTRSYRPKHWDDHVAERGLLVPWHHRDAFSRQKVNAFLRQPTVGAFACGSTRTFAEYEEYAGLDFRRRRVQDYTRLRRRPPNPPQSPDWAEQVRTWQVQITMDRGLVPTLPVEDCHFWYLGLHDAFNEEIFRADVFGAELYGYIVGNDPRIVITREFASDREPATWTVWPVSHSRGWLEKISGAIG
jgi:hypothetical protein